MEVHSHAHTPRKNLKHYFWDFLMLFLAVFCGFLAEYQLEHIIEHQREKAYMQSLAEDIRQDIKVLDDAIENIGLQIRGKDSLVQLMGNPITTQDQTNRFYDLHWLFVGYVTEIPFSKRTMNQLLNAGGLRLVRNKKVSDAIAAYAAKVDYHERTRQPQYIDVNYRALFASQKLIDTRFLRAEPRVDSYIRAPHKNPEIFTDAGDLFKDFAFLLEMDKENCILFAQHVQEHKHRAVDLLQLLENEYKIK